MKRTIAILLLASLAGCDSGRMPSWTGAKAASGAAEAGEWTILLCRLSHPDQHVQHAATYKQRLTEDLGWKGVFTINKAGHSEVYWGRYGSTEQAQGNLRTAKAHKTQLGTRPFRQAMLMRLPGARVGPPEWDLTRVDAAYTYLVATFQDDRKRNYVGRKKFAVRYCRRLREEGNYDAYYYHGPSSSHVTIGRFEPGSVRIHKEPQGERLEILDPRIRAIQQDFPLLQVNGSGVNDLAWDPQNRKMIRIPKKTYLIRVPREEAGHGS